MKQRLLSVFCLILALCLLCGCTQGQGSSGAGSSAPESSASVSDAAEPAESVPEDIPPAESSGEESVAEPVTEPEPVEEEPVEEPAEPEPEPAPEEEEKEPVAEPAETEPESDPEPEEEEKPVEKPAENSGSSKLIVIDAGHQAHGNSETEPIGPGASERKPKVSSGTEGCSTGIPEYKLTLSVSLKLRDELEQRGYEVLMVRTDHDVNISNAERAAIANDAGAGAFLRIHADGVDDSSVHGISTLCQTASNPYNADLYKASRKLADCVLKSAAAASGAKKREVMETDTMSGINWCQVPTTIVELGFMSNPEEDERMSQEDYQWSLASGIADGVDTFFR